MFRYPRSGASWPGRSSSPVPQPFARATRRRLPAALMGFALRSVAPARGTEAFSPRTPTCRFADDPPRSFFPGDRRRCSVELWRRPRTFAAAPGFCPRGQSVPPTPCGISAAETAVGFFLSQVCGSPDSARRRIIAPAGSLSAPLPGPIRSWASGESFPVFVAITRLPHARRRGHEPWNDCRDEPSTPFNSRRAHPCTPPPAPDCSGAKRQDHSPALQRIEGLLPCRSPGENSYAHGLRPCVPPRPPRDRQPV